MWLAVVTFVFIANSHAHIHTHCYGLTFDVIIVYDEFSMNILHIDTQVKELKLKRRKGPFRSEAQGVDGRAKYTSQNNNKIEPTTI